MSPAVQAATSPFHAPSVRFTRSAFQRVEISPTGPVGAGFPAAPLGIEPAVPVIGAGAPAMPGRVPGGLGEVLPAAPGSPFPGTVVGTIPMPVPAMLPDPARGGDKVPD